MHAFQFNINTDELNWRVVSQTGLVVPDLPVNDTGSGRADPFSCKVSSP